MSLKRYFATKDNTITNAFKTNLTTRGVSGNMGQSDILETFYIYGQASSGSQEQSRILIEFNTTAISTDRTNSVIPASGSVSFFLRMYNAEHSQPTPKDFKLIVSAVSRSWAEGDGLDMENYSDEQVSNWISGNLSASVNDDGAWTTEGGDYLTDSSSSFTASFDTGFEDMELDISPLVEQWISSSDNSETAFDMGEKSNYGVGIRLTSSILAGSSSYYNKMFFARGSQFFFKRPTLEARWNDSKKDNRGNFYLSSSLVPSADNLMKLYLYNIVRGQLTNIPPVGTNKIYVSLYSGSAANTAPSGSKLQITGGNTLAPDIYNTTASYVETGIYSASFAFTVSTALKKIWDIWHLSGTEYHTGSAITPKTFDSYSYNFDQKYVSKVTNLRAIYSTGETVRFRLYVRPKDWSPTIYTVASKDVETSIIEDAYYKIVRVSDNLKVIPFGTGTLNYTRLSYDVSGSYFDLKMDLFDTDTVYELSFNYLINGSYVDQPEKFRFRVE